MQVRRSLEERTLAYGDDHVEQTVIVGFGLPKQFRNHKAVACGQLTAEAVAKQATQEVLGQVVFPIKQKVCLQLAHAIDLRAIGNTGDRFHFFGIDGFEVSRISGKIGVSF